MCLYRDFAMITSASVACFVAKQGCRSHSECKSFKKMDKNFTARGLFFSLPLSQPIWAAITEYHRLDVLHTTEIYFSLFWRLGRPRSRLADSLRACFQVHGQWSSHWILTFYKDTNPIMAAPPSCPNYLLKALPTNSIISGNRFQHKNFGGPHIFSLQQVPSRKQILVFLKKKRYIL